MDQLIGKELANGRFRIIGDKPLGKGGFATVYLGIQKQLNRKVAIKVLSASAAEEQGIVKRFIREARVVASFDHPNIIKVIDSGSENGIHYFVMNYLHSSLHNLMTQDEYIHGLPIDKWLSIAKDISSALNYMHHHSLVKEFIHRDIKPGNIMFDDSDHAILTDFGLVKSDEFSQLTLKDTVMGTPKYMSPEQVRGTDLDHRSDLYSFGIVLYEMLVGRPPFAGEPLTICHKQIAEEPPPPRTFNPSVEPELESIIMKSIEKEPKKRYQSAGQLLSALEDWENNSRNHQFTPTRDISASAPTLIKTQRTMITEDDSTQDTLPTSAKTMTRDTGQAPSDPDTTQRRRRKSKKPYYLIGAILGILAISTALVFIFQQKSQTTRIGYLHLTSDPPQARIFLDGEDQDIITSYTLSGKIGDTLNVELKKDNYETISKEFIISRLDTFHFYAQLKPIQKPVEEIPPERNIANSPTKIEEQKPVVKTGTLEIISKPSGANIYVNGYSRRIKTDAQINLEEGTFNIELKKSGYKNWTGSTDIIAGRIRTLSVDLQPIETHGTVTINSRPFWGYIWIDGKNTDYDTPKEIRLKARKEPYKITVKRFGYNNEAEREVTVLPGDVIQLSFTLDKQE